MHSVLSALCRGAAARPAFSMYRCALVEGVGSVSKIAGSRAGYFFGRACGPVLQAQQQAGLTTAVPASSAGQRWAQEHHGRYQQQQVRGVVEPTLVDGSGCTRTTVNEQEASAIGRTALIPPLSAREVGTCQRLTLAVRGACSVIGKCTQRRHVFVLAQLVTLGCLASSYLTIEI